MRRFKLTLSLSLIALIYLGVVVFAITPHFPSTKDPLLFYSNQTRNDIKLLFAQALKKARKSIHITMYALTDPDIIHILRAKHEQGVTVQVFYDPSATPHKTFEPDFPAYSIQSSGLMHRKIVIVDDELVFLGSANMTTQSLSLHDNLVFGFHHPDLAHFLKRCDTSSFSFSVGSQQGILWLLPESGPEALQEVISTISQATQTIKIAMFTLTHPDILNALLAAQARGISITIAVDYFTGQGASANMIEKLQEAGIAIRLSMGRELLHYKWALIDDQKLLVGSTNWTKAGFGKNYDFLLIFNSLTPEQTNYMNTLWHTIIAESD